MVVGRDRECARLREVLARSVDGQPQVVALRGDPGIGKTELLTYCASVAEGFRVVRVLGIEAERDIPYAALSMLVGPLLGEATDLADVQSEALAAAMNLGSAANDDRIGVAAAALAVMTAAAARTPLLLAIDDLHLLDEPTLDALFFLVRRIHQGSLAVVMTARNEEFVPDAVARRLDSVAEIRLGGLDLDAARELTRERGVLSEATWAATGGNPLALLEMTDPLDEADPDTPIALPARLLRAYVRRLAGLPDATRDALLILAVAGRAADVLDAGLSAAGLTRADLDPAEEAGLLVADGEVRFAQQLVRSAVYQSVSPAARRDAHRVMALGYVGRSAPGAVERRAHHLAAATATPDESVAADIAAAARGAQERHSHTTAASLFELAARLTPVGEQRTQRMLDAAIEGQAAGRLSAVGPLLEMAVAESDNDDLRTLGEHLLCRVRMWSGGSALARDQLLDLAGRTEPNRPAWSAVMRAQAAIVSIAVGEQRSAAAMAERAAELTRDVPDERNVAVLVAVAATRAINGDSAGAREALGRCAPYLPDCDPLSIDQILVQAALAYASLDDLGPARSWLEVAAGRARREQATGLLPFQLSWLAQVCWLAGDWQSALAHGDAAVQFAEETGWATELPNCLVALATVEVGRGAVDAAHEHLTRAVAVAAEQGMAGLFAAHQSRLTGLLALGAGRFDEAARLLQSAGEFAVAHGLGDPVLFGWAGDLTESLVRSAPAEKARWALRAVVQEAERTGRPTELAVAARCRGLMADNLADGRAAFDEALRRHGEATRPFEEARTRLCFGEFLRRFQRRDEAREHLDTAIAEFTRLGAAGWTERAEAAYRATGVTARRRTVDTTQDLTSQEMQVALAVADGGRNAEVAGALFIATKTVEFHLSNIYRKLGITSRSQLTRVMSERQQKPPSGG